MRPHSLCTYSALPIWLEISHFTDRHVGVPTDFIVGYLVKFCTPTEGSILQYVKSRLGLNNLVNVVV